MWRRNPISHRLDRIEAMADTNETNQAVVPQAEAEPPMKLRATYMPTRMGMNSCIVMPEDSGKFTVRSGVIQILPTFHGMESENPYLHVKEFENVCSTCADEKVKPETIHLKLFPFSLKDKAKQWFNSLMPGSITTWVQLQEAFLRKFFSMHRTQALQGHIMHFTQKQDESIYKTWERFKDILLQVPTSRVYNQQSFGLLLQWSHSGHEGIRGTYVQWGIL